MSLLSVLASLASRSGRLSVLIFHRVLPRPDPLFPSEPDAARFDRLMALVARHFRPMDLAEGIERLAAGSLPPRALAVTFDDGYADNATEALPILQRHGIPATYFVASGFLDGGRMWNDSVIEAVRLTTRAELDLDALGLGRHPVGGVAEKRAAIHALIGRLKYLPFDERARQVAAVAEAAGAALPDDLMMSSDQLRAVHAAGIAVGGHTVSHPILARLPDAEARREIAAGRERLAEILRAPVPLFAYPNGKPGEDYRPEHVRMARELGFDAAVSTAWGVSTGATDRFQLPRFTPWDADPTRFALRLVHNMTRTRPALLPAA